MLTEQKILDILSIQCSQTIEVSTKRPGIIQVHMPYYYPDGDPVEIFIEQINKDMFKVSDYGLSLMKMSYSYNIDSLTNLDSFKKIALNNRLQEENGTIYIEVNNETLYSALSSIADGIGKICNSSK